MCCLKQPFKANDFPSLFRKVLKGEYLPIQEKYSDNMKELVRMCLTSEPEMRPSASELL
jgi:serine/threonine protein kinase